MEYIRNFEIEEDGQIENIDLYFFIYFHFLFGKKKMLWELFMKENMGNLFGYMI